MKLYPIKPNPSPHSGIALIVTLAVVAMLTISIVAFLSSVTLDVRTSDAYLSKVQAEFALKAGLADAESRLAALMQRYPYHAIAYEETAPGEFQPILLAGDGYATEPTPHYLISGGGSETPPALFNADAVDLNIKESPDDPNGWIGSPIEQNGDQTHRPARALWQNLLTDPTKPPQPDPNTADYNPVIARYAYFIEDETSKINVRVSGNNNGPALSGNQTFQRDPQGVDPSNLDIGALPLRQIDDEKLVSLDLDNPGAELNDRIITFRENTAKAPFLVDPLWMANAVDADYLDRIRYHTSHYSKSNELAGTGRRRVNLNGLVQNSADPSVIAGDLDDIVWLITGQHLFQGSILGDPSNQALFETELNEEGPMPDFGERLFKGTHPNVTNKATLYLSRIAANIRDLVDTDRQPTVVQSDGSIVAGQKMLTGWSFTSPPPRAIGKERLPYLQEHAWKGFIESWSQTGNVVTANLRFDHYFEFYNPYAEGITLPQSTYLRVYDMPGWLTGNQNGGQLVPPDFELDLSGIVITAGDAVVITTNNTGQHPPNMVEDEENLIVLDPVQGTTRVVGARSDERISSVRGLQLQGRSSSITDYRTQMIWGTDLGVFDHFPAISISLQSSSQWNITSRGNNIGSHTRFVYSSSMRGNDAESRSGDPRSLSEQLRFLDYSGGGTSDQTRFYGNIQGHGDSGSGSNIPGTSSFGQAQIQWVQPSNWPDYNPELDDTSATAPTSFRNDHLTFIGELGQVYDPHRKRLNDIRYARGGGRTLRIGQRDDLVNPVRFGDATSDAEAWRNGAFHLTDLFSAEPNEDPLAPASAPGKININSVLRDGGVALRAALRDYHFHSPPLGDPIRAGSTGGNPMEENEIDRFLEDLTAYLQGEGPYQSLNTGPMISPGELSQLFFFSENNSNYRAGGANGATVNDRSREELFRRTFELITTRSHTFSVYCLAQSVQQGADGRLFPLAIERRRFVVEFIPQFDETSPGDEPAARVQSYDTRLLYEGL